MAVVWHYDDGMAFLKLRVPEAFVALFQAIIESYEGVALVRTYDVAGSVMVIACPREQCVVLEPLLEDLGRITPWSCEGVDGESLSSLLVGKKSEDFPPC